MSSSITRAGVWGPPAGATVFCGFFLLTLSGGRMFYLAMTIAVGYWLVRSLRVRVEIDADRVSVYGQLRTRRFALKDIERASTGPMRTASPFAGSFPYVALELHLVGGRVRHFEEVSAREADRADIDAVAESINAAI